MILHCIDQTQYGIPKNKNSLNEPGASFIISHELKLMKTVVVLNRLQLFTNYIHNPQNVDVDWEMIATAHLNWFTDVRFNTHLIFDDDTKTSEQDSKGKPILLPDGTEKKTARIQFKELWGCRCRSGFRNNALNDATALSKIFLVYPELLDYFASNSFIFTSHLSIVFEYKMTVESIHFMIYTGLKYFNTHQHIESFSPVLFL